MFNKTFWPETTQKSFKKKTIAFGSSYLPSSKRYGIQEKTFEEDKDNMVDETEIFADKSGLKVWSSLSVAKVQA